MKPSFISPSRLALLLPILLLTTSRVFPQGALAPIGPPAPTMKSLSDIDTRVVTVGERRIDVLTLTGDANNQYIIGVQGSYYLSGKITGVSGKNGISIQTTNVSLDLNGFQVQGVAGSLSGIVVSGSRRSV